MHITDIERQKVKITGRTITVKDDEGKTRGMVRNVIPFKELPANKQIDYWKKIKDFGIENFYFYDNDLYYILNLKSLDFYIQYIAGRSEHPLYEEETKKYNKRKEDANKIKEFATVIPCYII